MVKHRNAGYAIKCKQEGLPLKSYVMAATPATVVSKDTSPQAPVDAAIPEGYTHSDDDDVMPDGYAVLDDKGYFDFGYYLYVSDGTKNLMRGNVLHHLPRA